MQQQILLDEIIPAEHYNNNLKKECYVITYNQLGSTEPHQLYLARNNAKPVAAVIETTAPDGYAESINLSLGADFYGNALGIRVIEHHETRG